jgi:hypothetical protein
MSAIGPELEGWEEQELILGGRTRDLSHIAQNLMEPGVDGGRATKLRFGAMEHVHAAVMPCLAGHMLHTA